MKFFATISLIFATGIAHAQERAPEGVEFCREKAAKSILAGTICYENWERSLLLYLRYSEFAGVIDEDGNLTIPSFSDIFVINPFKLNRRRLLDNCTTTQVFNGNIFSGNLDYKEIWACIVKTDPVAARWDTI